MKKYNKYTALFLLVILGTATALYAQEDGTSPVGVSADSTTRIEVKDIRINNQDDREEMRRKRLENEAEIRKERNDEIMKLRTDTRVKIESGELKPSEAYKMINEQAKELREKTREDIKNDRDDFKMAVKEDREAAKEMIEEKRDSLLSSIQERRDLFKQEFEVLREEMKARHEALREKFQADLLKIKDENRRTKVENISNNFTEINIQVTARASTTVDKIEAALVSIESRADKAAVNGADVTNVRALIVTAETAIADARTAITTQIAKVYSSTISSDGTVKASLQSTRDQFRADLKVMKDKIKAAHSATKRAAEALKNIPNVDAEVSVNVEATTN